MSENQMTFDSVSGKRRILLVEDDAVISGLLGSILEQEYDVLYAEDAAEALAIIRENREVLSLILLDLILPGLSGQAVLRHVKEDPTLSRIPVIVASADQTQEIASLDAGAGDFIRKPYPEPGVILARIRRAIELADDRVILQATERDPLTDLYNLKFFYRYAEQFDLFHPDTETDAIALEIGQFTVMEERYGKPYAVDILRRVGECVREMARASGGIACRKEVDTFLVYCPHRQDYKTMLDDASTALAGDATPPNNRLRLRMGVYSNADKTLEIERRFARAQMAADSVRDSRTRNIGVFDDTLYTSELYAKRLLEDFSAGLEARQFVVCYQPKFDIRSPEPLLCGAEALVRWEHPELGTITPGVFVPLFEENGLIRELDHYVWREVARQMRTWKDRLGCTVPVSVNISRTDLYDPNVAQTLQAILSEHGLESHELPLELSESACTEDAEPLIETVRRLRSIGFCIELDDFGSGYSSLSMLSTLPVDALKLDTNFIRTAFVQEQDTPLPEIIVAAAARLSVPVIAEGVETEAQLQYLRKINCDVAQGFYFSDAVPAEAFEPFLLTYQQRGAAEPHTEERAKPEKPAAEQKQENVDAKWWDHAPAISMRLMGVVFAIAAIFLSIALYVLDLSISRDYKQMEDAASRYIAAQQSATNLEIGSDYLTDRVRCFVITGNIHYLKDFYEETEVTRRRDIAVATLEELMGDSTNQAYSHLNTALTLSNHLVNYERLAMRYIIEAGDYDSADIPASLRDVALPPDG